MPTQRVTFPNLRGELLSGLLDRPAGRPRAVALLAHCFACSKDLKGAANLSRGLTETGLAVLRFDFTGLGESEGDFADTTYSSNVEDLVAAARYLSAEVGAPRLLVGHSLGGAAVLHAAARLEAVRAVATVNAPSEPGHLLQLLGSARQRVEADGEARVTIGGRTFTLRRPFVEDLAGARLRDTVAALPCALLLLHSPQDAVVPVEHAARLYAAAHHPRSFVSLDQADHLLSRPADAAYAAAVIAAWAGPYLAAPASLEAADPTAGDAAGAGAAATGNRVRAHLGRRRYATALRVRGHALTADEPADAGGGDAGPTPYDLLLAALGACTAMTLRIYADHKGWDLEAVQVELGHERIHAQDCAECEGRGGKVDRIERRIRLEGALDPAQRQRLREIADRCPVHRTLTGRLQMRTELVSDGG